MLLVKSVEIEEEITHNLLICDPIVYPALYQFSHGSPDLDVLQVIFSGRVGVIVIIFTQYNVGMGICLDLDEARTTPLNPLTFNLPFPHCFFHIMAFPTCSVVHAMECLTC